MLVVGSLIVSVAAQALSLPLVLSTFGSVSLLNPFVNLVAILLTGLVVPLGFLSGVVGLVALPLSRLINIVTNGLTGLLIQVAEWGAALPSLPWGEIEPLGYLYYAVGVTALVLVVRGLLRPWRGLLVLSVAILCSMLSAPSERPPEIVYLDVGQGDSALIRLPGRVEILVDGGGTPFSDFDIGARTVVPALRALGVDELELVIATHADTDHMEGLVSVLEQMPVQQLVVGIPNPDNPLYTRLQATAEARNVPIVPVLRGQSLSIGAARLDILHPANRSFEDENENSVAFVLNYQNVPKALFLGDLSTEIEKSLAFPNLDIVMAGHHGSRYSSSPELIAATTPAYAIFSYGRNNYGHPNREVVARFEAAGATIYETFRHGAVRLPLD
ncbi:MAG: ComEC/Rec2 family competence protein [Trueperaceae bacterium]|nr:ComEC/Rec2 family competence protein [Trueperaceae bacterium]